MSGAAQETLAAEIAAEQAYLDRVNARLDAAEADAVELGREAVARKAVMDDGGGVREDHYRGLYESDVFMQHAVLRQAVLNAQREGLLFGRLDYATGETRYVGRLGVRDEAYDTLVLDWRAPAAEPYYRATPLDPKGVVRRRTITSSDRHVVAIDDDLLDADHVPPDMVFVGDGALLTAMSRTRDDRMGTIVATIQADQDAAIRAPATGTTLITGGPGTGKTVVALHRVAYLLFTDRRRFEAGGVLVVGPSAAFVRYIDRVLPSLGEESVVLKSLGSLVDGVATARTAYGLVAEVKASARMVTVLGRAVDRCAPPPAFPLKVAVRGKRLEVSLATAARLREEAYIAADDYESARQAGQRALLDALWEQARGGRALQMTRAEFTDEVRHSRAFGRFVKAWWRPADPRQVLSRLRDRAFFASCAAGVLTDAEVNAFVASWGPGARVTVADVPVLDEVVALTGESLAVAPPPPVEGEEHPARREPQEFAHIVVDEAQELTPMQWRMLARRGRRATWTVVADQAQSALSDRDAARAAMAAALPGPRHEHRLSTNYRNPREIFDFAARALGDQAAEADLPYAARSGGRQPEVRTVAAAEVDAALEQAVRDLLAEVAGTVAVVVADEAAKEAFGGLAEADPARVRVVTALECKGLEYDGVAVAQPERIAALGATPAIGARLLYVVLTRATQHLVCVTTSAAWSQP
jgi:DNA helicase IV